MNMFSQEPNLPFKVVVLLTILSTYVTMPLLIFYVNDENSSDDTAAFYLFAHEESETDGWYS